MSEPIVLTTEQARRYLHLVKQESERKRAAAVRERTSVPHGTRDSLPPALLGLLSSIPPEQMGWTQERRDQFYAAFGSVLDYCIPIRDAADDGDDDRKVAAM